MDEYSVELVAKTPCQGYYGPCWLVKKEDGKHYIGVASHASTEWKLVSEEFAAAFLKEFGKAEDW